MGLEVCNETARPAVEDRAPVAVVADNVFVGVPVGPNLLRTRVLGAAVDLHEPHAPLHEPPGEQALPAKGADLRMVELVETLHDL